MGFFDGLFGKNVKAKTFGFETKLPDWLRPQGMAIAGDTFKNYGQMINRGETPEETALFNASRAQSVGNFNDAVGNAQSRLHRQGMGSSGERDKQLAALSMGLSNQLTTQDAQRAAYLLQQRQQAMQAGMGAVLQTANQGQYIPAHRNPGLFDGLGTKLIGGGINAGLGAMTGGMGGMGGFASSIGGGLGGMAGNALGGLGGSVYEGGMMGNAIPTYQMDQYNA